MATMARISRTMSRRLERRADSWFWKNVAAMVMVAGSARWRVGRGLELDLDCLLLLVRLGRGQLFGWLEAKVVAHQVARELLRGVVVGHHGVVEGLAREGDLVLRAGELLAHLHHVLVGFQIRIGLGHGEKERERTAQRGPRRFGQRA